MAAFGIHELRKQTEEEFPEATYDETFGGARDKVVGAVKDANIGERVGEQASKLRLPERLQELAAAGDDPAKAGDYVPDKALPVPRMTKLPAGPPFEYVDVGAKIPNYVPSEKWGTQGEPLSSMARAAVGQHKYAVIEKGDDVIMSARMIPGNETAIYRMIDHLCRRGAEVHHGGPPPGGGGRRFAGVSAARGVAPPPFSSAARRVARAATGDRDRERGEQDR